MCRRVPVLCGTTVFVGVGDDPDYGISCEDLSAVSLTSFTEDTDGSPYHYVRVSVPILIGLFII